MEVEKPRPKQEAAPEVKQSWWSRAWASVSNFFSPKPELPVYKKPDFSEQDKTEIDELRIDGAQRVARVTGVVKVGEAEELSEESRMQTMMSRFGMI